LTLKIQINSQKPGFGKEKSVENVVTLGWAKGTHHILLERKKDQHNSLMTQKKHDVCIKCSVLLEWIVYSFGFFTHHDKTFSPCFALPSNSLLEGNK
jgi:hypothetical protein